MSKQFNLDNADRVGKGFLVQYLVENSGQSRNDAEESVNAVLEAIATALRAGVNVSLSNLGTLRRETAAGRTHRNPQDGSRLWVDAQETVRWTISPTLADVLNGRDQRDKLATKAPKGSRVS